jgi:hypothetical protein
MAFGLMAFRDHVFNYFWLGLAWEFDLVGEETGGIVDVDESPITTVLNYQPVSPNRRQGLSDPLMDHAFTILFTRICRWIIVSLVCSTNIGQLGRFMLRLG